MAENSNAIKITMIVWPQISIINSTAKLPKELKAIYVIFFM